MFEGLEARCQNAWPSVQFDLMAINSLASPFLSAGFYYKTFMGPSRGSWMFYEPFIRKAAGLGTAVHERDPDRYEARHAFADVLVVGGGHVDFWICRRNSSNGDGVHPPVEGR